MDIALNKPYPACNLSNLADHTFLMDGISCGSMEGFLQSLKFKDSDQAKKVCLMKGIEAKKIGKSHQSWTKDQTLWWKGKPYSREGKEYQLLLDRAYATLSWNPEFSKALLETRGLILTHKIGHDDPKKTILTEKEFIGKLTWLRDEVLLKEEENNEQTDNKKHSRLN